MRVHGIFGIAVGLAFTLLMSEAQAQCPSSRYFRANASNAIGQFGSKVDSTVCLAITTRTTQINAKAVVSAQIADIRRLQQTLISRLSSSCEYNSVGGWDITDLNISISGSGNSSRVRVNAVGHNCLSGLASLARGVRLTFEAPVSVVIASNVVTLRLDTTRARVSFTRGGGSLPIVFSTAANRIGAALNETFNSPLDLSGYIPPQARGINPNVTQLALSVQSNKLVLKANISGQVKKPEADRLLSNAVDREIVPPFLRWLNRGRGCPAFC